LELIHQDQPPPSSSSRTKIRHVATPSSEIISRLQKAFSGARRSKTTIPKHPHAHPLLYNALVVASFECFSPPPIFTLATYRDVFLPALNEAAYFW
jgi:hypothetical protein